MTSDLRTGDLTEAVVASFQGSASPRYREVMQALVRHLHGLVEEVELTEQEWHAAIEFLTRVGQITDDRRQEFILLSDVLGLSMQVVGLNHSRDSQATEPTVFGPFFVEGSPAFENGDDIAAGAPGEPCFFSGRVLSDDGEAIVGARVEIWQADDQGMYDVQYADLDAPRGREHLVTDAGGRFSFWSVKPVAYPIPDDGPVGDLLKAAGRGPMRPAHVHFMVSADGWSTLTTHVFVAGDEYLDSDAVFGVRSSLICEFKAQTPGSAPDGRLLDEPYWVASYDLILHPAAES